MTYNHFSGHCEIMTTNQYWQQALPHIGGYPWGTSRGRARSDGPLEVFAGANRVLGARGPAYDVRVVSSQPKPMLQVNAEFLC